MNRSEMRSGSSFSGSINGTTQQRSVSTMATVVVMMMLLMLMMVMNIMTSIMIMMMATTMRLVMLILMIIMILTMIHCRDDLCRSEQRTGKREWTNTLE